MITVTDFLCIFVLSVASGPRVKLVGCKRALTPPLVLRLEDGHCYPLFKKGDKSDPGHYRPISLPCVCFKLMEHIVASHLIRHLGKYNILYDLQHGFRERRSCETQLIQLVDELARNSSSGHQIYLILLEFSKAFDNINHIKLLHKLHQHGVSSHTPNWIKAFLLGRTQCVALEGDTSSYLPVTSGVHLGSVLGPILFLLYINDLFEQIHSQVRLFVDDTAIYLAVNSESNCNKLRKDLQKLEIWEKNWEMDFFSREMPGPLHFPF